MRPGDDRRNYGPFPYVQANSPTHTSLLVFDLDNHDADRAAGRVGLEAAFVAMNQGDEFGHVGIGLSSWVRRDEKGSKRAQYYVKRIWQGLNLAMGGDPCYVGLYMKNPMHSTYRSSYSDALYSLDDLRDALESIDRFPRLQRRADYTLREGTNAAGRNVALHENLRAWAFRAIRPYWDVPHHERPLVWGMAVQTAAAEMNEALFATHENGVLPSNEVANTAKSVAAFTFENVTRERFVRSQRERGARAKNQRQAAQASLMVRQMKAATRQRQVLDLGVSISGARKVSARRAAEILGVSERTVRNDVALPRQQYLVAAHEQAANILAMVEAGMSATEITDNINRALPAGETPKTVGAIRTRISRAKTAANRMQAAAAS